MPVAVRQEYIYAVRGYGDVIHFDSLTLPQRSRDRYSDNGDEFWRHRLPDIHDDFSSFQQSLFPSEIRLWMHKVT